MKKNDYYKLQTNILDLADDFEEAFNRCEEGKNFRIDEYGRGCYEVVNIPAIVNAAFSCELYIKYLLGKKRHGHNLKKLFILLDSEIQNRIRTNINEILDNRLFNFDLMLERASESYKTWRYIFEKKRTDYFMGTFINEHLKFFNLFLPELKKIAYEKLKLQSSK